MKITLKIIITLGLIFMMSMSVSAQGEASPKDEVVYGFLDANGTVKSIQVVNIFTNGSVVDFGDYRKLTNLSTLDPITVSGDMITAESEASRLYIQGDLKKLELPWIVTIQYSLDGQVIAPAQLGGKSGKLIITLSVNANPNINPTFAANMALQVGVTLDQAIISELKTEGATLAEAGSSKQITYTVLPNRSLNTSIEATVKNFEMDPITLNGVRMSLGFDVDTSSLKSELTQLSDAIAQLDDGALELQKGIKALSNGFNDYVLGVAQFDAGLAQLVLSGEALKQGAAALSTNLNLLTQQNQQLLYGALAIQQATFDAVNTNLAGYGLPTLTPANYTQVLDAMPSLAAVKAQLDGAVQFTQGLSDYLDGVVLLALGAEDLSNGLNQYQAANKLLAQSSNQLYLAAQKLNTALKQVKSGLAEYTKGTGQLHDETQDLDTTLENAIEDMISDFTGNGDPVLSFVSEKNTAISAVQFVLKTESIQAPKAEEPVEPLPIKRNFWEKLWDLFSGLFKS